MDHVLTSIAWGLSRRPTKFPLRSYKLALRTVAIFAPTVPSRKTSPWRIYSHNLAALRIDDMALEQVFLFCVSDVTFTTPNSVRCSGSRASVRACREMARSRCQMSLSDALDWSASRAIGAGATVWRGLSRRTATPS
jgi:hypothetical protein